MGRPPVKSTKKLIKAELETKAKFATSAKGIELALVDMINRIDPLEFLAISAGTFVVYDIMKATPEFLAQAQVTFTDTVAKLFLGPLFYPLYERIFGAGELTEEQKATLQKIRDQPDLILFVKCFFMSYILVKHSGQIIAGVGNVTGFIAGFLGMKVV